MDDEVTIKLSRDQAFVLSHWLHEVERSGELDAIVKPDYDARLEAAKRRLVEAKYGGWDGERGDCSDS